MSGFPLLLVIGLAALKQNCWLTCLWLLALVVPARADTSAEQAVAGFLSQHCIACHGGKKQEADLRLDQLKAEFSGKDVADHWNLVRYKLLAGEMPPADQPRPDRLKQQQVVSWIADQLRQADVPLIEPAGFFLPAAGNQVDHDLLFSGQITGPAATPARLWRMGPHAYDALIKGELAKNVKGLSQPFGELTSRGLKDYAAAFSIDEPTTDQLIRNAESIVQSQTRGELKAGKWFAKGYPQPVKEFVHLFEPANQPLSTELKVGAIAKQFQLILRRAPTAEEQRRYVGLMDRTIADTGLVTGVRTALVAVLLSPAAVYRFELGSGQADADGRRMLSPREMAFAIAFALTDRRPDDSLLRTAAEGELATPADVAREVQRILASDKIAKPRIMRFFREFFGYPLATDVFKDSALNKHHRADVLVHDTERLIQWILDRDQDVFEQLMTTNKAFVNYQFDAKRGPRIAQAKNLVHTSYGLPVDWKWTPHQPIDLPPEERAGILTQPSWLVANSGNFDNHPILRGKWVREHLLGGTIPDLPITVDAQLPEEPQHTLRQRMRVTREEYCWNCHNQMNPLGLTFEIFDHFGRFRTLEAVLDREATAANVDHKGNPRGDIMRRVPVDASGWVDRTDPKVHKQHPHAVAMIHDLARSDRARQMFVRYTFRYFLGRNEELSDSPTLIAADRDYVRSGGSFRRLVESLITSDSFLYRVDPTSATNPQ